MTEQKDNPPVGACWPLRQVIETYRPIGGGGRPPGQRVTPDKDVPAAIRRIVSLWNGSVPAGRVRFVNQVRYGELRESLAHHTADDVCRAIEWYAGQPWNRQRGAWMTFDHFIQSANLTAKIEQAAEWRESVARKDRDKAARIETLQKQVDEKVARDRREAARRKAFDALPGPTKYAYLKRAKADAMARRLPDVMLTGKLLTLSAIAMYEAECGPLVKE